MQDNVLQQMKQLEERYAYENELMDIVSKGLTQRAEVMMSSVSQLSYQSRTSDPLRNMKNYCIICNTLLRKAAEKGGEEGLYRMALLYSEGHGVEKDMEKAKECCMKVREDLTYSDTCVFEEDWKQEVELLLENLKEN